MQRTVIRQGSKTGLNYLQHLYLQLHRPSISRLHSHVMSDLSQGRMSNPLCNRKQLISLHFKNIYSFTPEDTILFLARFASQIPVESTNTHTYAHRQLLKLPYTSHTFQKLLWHKQYSYESCININQSLHYFLCCTLCPLKAGRNM